MDHVLELADAMERYAELAAAAYGTEAVPSCPGWTVDDLTDHLGTMHRWAASILLAGQRLDEPVGVQVTGSRADWYAPTAAALLAAVRAVPAGEPTPNFARVHETAAFWPRRQAHETTIHAVDASLALGLGVEGAQVSASLAADGVDEVLGVFLPRMTARGQRPHLEGRVRFAATDTGRTWVVGVSPTAMRTPVLLFSDADVDADGEVRGSAVDLYLGLWGRAPHHLLEVDGVAARNLLGGPLVP